MNTVSQTPPAVVIVEFDPSIPLAPLTARTDSIESTIALYLRRVLSAATELNVLVGAPGRVTSNGQLVATFKVTPIARRSSGSALLGVAA